MFIFRNSLRIDKLESPDPLRAEWESSILMAPPGPLDGPRQTFEQFREARLMQAGFGPAVRVVFRGIVGGVERFECAETGIQPPSSSADASAGRSGSQAEQVYSDSAPEAVQATTLSAGVALQHIKDINVISESRHTGNPAQGPVPTTVLAITLEETVPEPVSVPSLIGLSDADSARIHALASRPKRTRRRPPTPRKSRKKKSKLKRLKTISNHEHEAMVTAYLVAQALGFPLNVALDFNPGIDHLDDQAKMDFWADLIINIRSYIKSRCRARGMRESWWPFVFIGVRESKRHNSQNEHFHGLIHVPDLRELRHLREHLKEMQKKVDRIWCRDIVAKKADDQQRIKGRKIGSRLNYLLKAAHRDTRAKDPYIIYRGSGFITGKRIKISTNLTDPKVVASVKERVATLRRLREERRSVLIAEILRRDAPPPYPCE